MGWQAQLLGKKKHATKDWEHRKWVNEAVYTFKAHTTTVVEENCQPVHLENSMGVEGLRAEPDCEKLWLNSKNGEKQEKNKMLLPLK